MTPPIRSRDDPAAARQHPQSAARTVRPRQEPLRTAEQPTALTARHDRPLTDTTRAWIAARLIAAVGIASLGDVEACRWVALRHARDHVHLVATLVRQDGRLPEMRGNWYRMRETCDRIEAEFGLLPTRRSRV